MLEKLTSARPHLTSNSVTSGSLDNMSNVFVPLSSNFGKLIFKGSVKRAMSHRQISSFCSVFETELKFSTNAASTICFVCGSSRHEFSIKISSEAKSYSYSITRIALLYRFLFFSISSFCFIASMSIWISSMREDLSFSLAALIRIAWS